MNRTDGNKSVKCSWIFNLKKRHVLDQSSSIYIYIECIVITWLNLSRKNPQLHHVEQQTCFYLLTKIIGLKQILLAMHHACLPKVLSFFFFIYCFFNWGKFLNIFIWKNWKKDNEKTSIYIKTIGKTISKALTLK